MPDRNQYIIGLDFDGTMVKHEYPQVGADIGAEKWVRAVQNMGASLILFTMRSERGLDDAVNWFDERSLTLLGINKNPNQHTWTSSPKPYCHLYVDDAALGIPLIVPARYDRQPRVRPWVDWSIVGPMLLAKAATGLHKED